MDDFILKFGFFSKKTGVVSDKEVFDIKGKCIGKYSGSIANKAFNGEGVLVLEEYQYIKINISSGSYNDVYEVQKKYKLDSTVSGKVENVDVYDIKSNLVVGTYSGYSSGEGGFEYIDNDHNNYRGGTLVVKNPRKLPNKIIYTGNWKDGMLNGDGKKNTFKYKYSESTNLNGEVRKEMTNEQYIGDFLKNMFNGKGKHELTTIEYQYDGNNKKIYPYSFDFISYEGMFNSCVKNGFGEYKKFKGKDFENENPIMKVPIEIYNGEWQNDRKHGKGVLSVFRDSDFNKEEKYDGYFKNDVFVKGIKTEIDGKKIEYEINDFNCYIGNVIVTDKDNNIFEFELDRKEIGKNFSCKGKIKFNSGSSFEGDFIDYSICKLSNNSSSTYRRGTLKTENGIFIGTFKKGGEFDGKFEINWTNGDRFVGNFINGFRKDGTFQWKDGRKYNGEFNENKQLHGFGRMDYPDGSFFEGKWENDKKHGVGKLFDSQGFIIQMGNWINGDFIDTTISDKISLD